MFFQFSFAILLVQSSFAQLPPLFEEFYQQRGKTLYSSLIVYKETQTTSIFSFTILNDRGDTVKGRIRTPKNAKGKFPLAFLVVGVETGKEVVNMIEGTDSVIVAAIDYPSMSPWDFSDWNAIKTAFTVRDNAYKTVPQLLLCLEWLFRHPLVDVSDVTVVAVSFGVFTAVPTTVIEKRIKQLVLIQAGGNMYDIVKANAERLQIPLPTWLAGMVGNWMYSEFEPNDYIGLLSPRPVLLVNGESDVLFPRSSVQSLFEHAKEPKEWIQHKSKHIMPGDQETINELTMIVTEKLYGKK
ncbi:MAG: hypothetical protein KGZ58_02355 [Ignavibacteriales bacterium]|nr:hypothetical protein [Ignavibacteriales bacterium]